MDPIYYVEKITTAFKAIKYIEFIYKVQIIDVSHPPKKIRIRRVIYSGKRWEIIKITSEKNEIVLRMKKN